MQYSLQGKEDVMKNYILVTGASSGIGRAVAEDLAEHGYSLVLLARDEKKLMQIKEMVSGKAEIHILTFDLKDLKKIEELFLYCKERNIKLDGMVHAAGISGDLPVKVNDVAFMEEMMAVNYYSFIELAKYFSSPKYSNTNASIVAISSMGTKYPIKGQAIYSATKAGIDIAVQIMAQEFMKRKIRVNAIQPAYVDTPMTRNLDDIKEDFYDELRKKQPLGMVEPEQVAYLTRFLLSDQAKYITGSLYPITGGYLG